MAQVTVKQMDFGWNGIGYTHNELRRDVDCYRGEELARLIIANKDKLRTVYVCELGGRGDKILDEAYALTQSVECPWYERADVLENGLVDVGMNGCRSTSIGDVIELAGVLWMVDSFGFICLEDVEDKMKEVS